MSVIVKGMSMPENCETCAYQTKGACFASGVNNGTITIRRMGKDRPDWCPLVEVKTPHGDLIDRQKLIEDNKHLEYPTDGKYRSDRAWSVGFNAGARHCNEHAIYAKTVIEAEGEG